MVYLALHTLSVIVAKKTSILVMRCSSDLFFWDFCIFCILFNITVVEVLIGRRLVFDLLILFFLHRNIYRANIWNHITQYPLTILVSYLTDHLFSFFMNLSDHSCLDMLTCILRMIDTAFIMTCKLGTWILGLIWPWAPWTSLITGILNLIHSILPPKSQLLGNFILVKL